MAVQVARGGILRITARIAAVATAAGANLAGALTLTFGGPGQIGLRYPSSQVGTDYGQASLVLADVPVTSVIERFTTAKVPDAAPLATYKVEITAAQPQKTGIGTPKTLKGTAEYTITDAAGGLEIAELTVVLS